MIKVVATDKVPQAIGPYSQAKVVGGFLFASGQIALDPNTGSIVGSTIEDQTHQVMKNILALIEAAGASKENIVKTTCFLHNIADFAKFNEIYAQYIGDVVPARSCVGGLDLPKGALCEVEVIVYVGE